jgi:hypothetical protein
MANENKVDIKLPFTEIAGGLALVEGNALASQRIVFGYGITPGDIVHRPEWGANLEDFANAKATDDNLTRLGNQARRFLGTLPFLEEFAVEIEPVGNSAEIQTKARTIDGDLLVPDVVI